MWTEIISREVFWKFKGSRQTEIVIMLSSWNKKENLISKLKNTSGECAATSFIKNPPPPPKNLKH